MSLIDIQMGGLAGAHPAGKKSGAAVRRQETRRTGEPENVTKARVAEKQRRDIQQRQQESLGNGSKRSVEEQKTRDNQTRTANKAVRQREKVERELATIQAKKAEAKARGQKEITSVSERNTTRTAESTRANVAEKTSRIGKLAETSEAANTKIAAEQATKTAEYREKIQLTREQSELADIKNRKQNDMVQSDTAAAQGKLAVSASETKNIAGKADNSRSDAAAAAAAANDAGAARDAAARTNSKLTGDLEKAKADSAAIHDPSKDTPAATTKKNEAEAAAADAQNKQTAAMKAAGDAEGQINAHKQTTTKLEEEVNKPLVDKDKVIEDQKTQSANAAAKKKEAGDLEKQRTSEQEARDAYISEQRKAEQGKALSEGDNNAARKQINDDANARMLSKDGDVTKVSKLHNDAVAKKKAAEEAKTKAEKAKKDAEEAKTKAEEAKTKTEEAKTKAEEAKKKADESKQAAEEAKTKAEEAKKKADESKRAAEEDAKAKKDRIGKDTPEDLTNAITKVKKNPDEIAAAKRRAEEAAAAKKRAEEEAAAAKRRREEEEAEAARRKKKHDDDEAEAARRKKERDDAEAKRKRDEEELKKKKDKDEAKRRRRDRMRTLAGMLVLAAVLKTDPLALASATIPPVPLPQSVASNPGLSLGALAPTIPSVLPIAPIIAAAAGIGVAGLGAAALFGAFDAPEAAEQEKWEETLTVYCDIDGNCVTERDKVPNKDYDTTGCLKCNVDENGDCINPPFYKGILTFSDGKKSCITYDTKLSGEDRFNILEDSDDQTGCEVCGEDKDEDEGKDEGEEKEKEKEKEEEIAPKAAAAEKKENLPCLVTDTCPEEKGEDEDEDEDEKPSLKQNPQTGGKRGETRRYRPPPSVHITKLQDILSKIKKSISHVPHYHMADVLRKYKRATAT